MSLSINAIIAIRLGSVIEGSVASEFDTPVPPADCCAVAAIPASADLVCCATAADACFAAAWREAAAIACVDRATIDAGWPPRRVAGVPDGRCPTHACMVDNVWSTVEADLLAVRATCES